MMGFALAARGLLCSAALVAAATVGQAQTYPSKPIRIILPYVPGGIIDTAGRNLALRLSESLGQSVVAENRPGAGGMVGADVAARATPDGYTILLTDPALVSNPTLQTDVPYDLFKGLQAVSIVGSSPVARRKWSWTLRTASGATSSSNTIVRGEMPAWRTMALVSSW